MKPPVAPNSPLPVLSVPEVRNEGPIQSEYEEVPSSASFQPLSAATINSSPCKSLPARPRSSPLSARKNSPRTSPSILLRKRSFDGRMQLLNGVNKLPSLEAVAPPVIKPEMVEEAKFLQAARALQRYASSGDEESDGDSAWETQPRKRSRTQVGAWAQRRSPHCQAGYLAITKHVLTCASRSHQVMTLVPRITVMSHDLTGSRMVQYAQVR